MFTFDQVKDEFSNKIRIERRKKVLTRITTRVFGELIRKVRIERDLTKEELGIFLVSD